MAIVAPTKIEVVDIGLIDVPIDNVRGEVGDIEELTESIRTRGLIHPPAVRQINGRYQLVAGTRRLAALKALGAKAVPVTIRDNESDSDSVVDQLVENLQRADVTPMREAFAFARLAELGVKQREIAKLVSVSQPHVSKRIALVNLPVEVQEAVDAGGINPNDAYALLDLKDNPDLLLRVFNNRGKGSIPTLIQQVKAAEAKRAEEGPKEEPTEDDLKAQKDAASKRRLLTKLTKAADEARGNALTALLKSRTAKGKMLDWTLKRLVEMTPVDTVEMAAIALSIPKIDDPEGFGQIRDLNGFIGKNPEENYLRLAFAIALVRGHAPLIGSKHPLQGRDLMFAESTLEYLSRERSEGGVEYKPNQAEMVLTGRLDVGEIAPPPVEKKEKKETAKQKAKTKKAKDPNAALEHQTDVRDDTRTAEAGSQGEGEKVQTEDLPDGVGAE